MEVKPHGEVYTNNRIADLVEITPSVLPNGDLGFELPEGMSPIQILSLFADIRKSKLCELHTPRGNDEVGDVLQ